MSLPATPVRGIVRNTDRDSIFVFGATRSRGFSLPVAASADVKPHGHCSFRVRGQKFTPGRVVGAIRRSCEPRDVTITTVLAVAKFGL
jgi:hypothetical protein